MKVKNVLLRSAIVLAVAPGMYATGSKAQSNPKTLTGVISDSTCGSTHMVKDKSPAECTQMCVKDGMKYALAAEKKVYTSKGHEAELAKLAGQRVTVKGTLKGDMLSVQEVAASK